MSGIDKLLVFEYAGTARSGKGTIVKHLASTSPDIARDETGADFRVLTRAMISLEAIEEDMDDDTVLHQANRFEEDELLEIVSRKSEIVSEFGEDSLYDSDVGALVAKVSKVPAVRDAVRGGFKRRVEAVRDEGESRVLLVDGRNLAKIIETVDNTRLVMRSFVTCSDEEAAQRDAKKKDLDMNTEAGRAEFQRIYNGIVSRNRSDRERPDLPVRPDLNPIDYWQDPTLFGNTATRSVLSHDFRDNMIMEIGRSQTSAASDKRQLRIGAGTLAVVTGRQLFFDTTPFRANYTDPEVAMSVGAEITFGEALTAFSQAHQTV